MVDDILLWLVVTIGCGAILGGFLWLLEWVGITGGQQSSDLYEPSGPTRDPQYREGDVTYTLCGYRAVCAAADWIHGTWGGEWEYLFVIHGPEGEMRYFYDECGSIQNRGHTTDRLLDLVEPAVREADG